MTKIVAVLKTGIFEQGFYKNTYKPEYAIRLRDQLAKVSDLPFVCLSDVSIDGVDVVELESGSDGWWNKVQIFKHFDDFIYFDLDLTILKDIEPLLETNGFRAYRDHIKRGEINSSIMRVKGDYKFIYDEFVENKQAVLERYSTRKEWGDQKFIENTLIRYNKEFDFFDDSLFRAYNFDKKPISNEIIDVYCGNLKPWSK